MKLQKTTWILLSLAILLGVGVYVYELQINPQKEELKAEKKQLFTFDEKQIKGLTIQTQEQTYIFEKTTDENQPWKMLKPQNNVANDAVISFLTNLLVSSESERFFTVSKTKKKDYGLEPPLATITIELDNNKKHKIILGKPDFQGNLIYAQIDPNSASEEEITINLIPKNFQYSIDRKAEEWINSN